jgi:DNA-directed RNA polymerase subunit RPC12/RpoP
LDTSAIGGQQGLRCHECGSTEIQICLPAFFAANGALEQPVSVDFDAEALSYWCPQCDATVAALAPNGKVLSGIWD